MSVTELIHKLKKLLRTRENGPASDVMRAYGMDYSVIHGLSISNIKEIANRFEYDSRLVDELYLSDVRELKLMSYILQDSQDISSTKLRKWVFELKDAEQAEQIAINLMAEMSISLEFYKEILSFKNEFSVKSAFVCIARKITKEYYTVNDEVLKEFLSLCIEESGTESIQVAKSISWVLRRIGRMSLEYNKLAIRSAEKIEDLKGKHSEFISSEVIFELKDESIISMIKS